MNAAETKQIAIRLPLDLVAFLEAEAQRDERTLAWVARKILMNRAGHTADAARPRLNRSARRRE